MKIQTKELTGVALDWAVAKVLGIGCYTCPNSPQRTQFVDDDNCDFGRYIYAPSTNWAQGGPLIENFGPFFNMAHGQIRCAMNNAVQYGDTYLIAICRAIVAAKLGDEVEVPNELAGAA